ncbi:MAG: chromosome partitioning protein [Deltaproteobacteria bacterium]|nr:MAG: chromosome partitioning protein [Deltaproteobacteria bacterium]
MTEATVETVTKALEGVIDPTFAKPMMAIGTLRDVKVEGQKLVAVAKLSSPSESVQKAVEDRVQAAVAELGIENVDLSFEVQIPTREVMGDDPLPGVRNIVLVMSGKGGVGKSTVAVNLTLALKRMGARVGLLDADIYGPSIPTMMGIQGQPRSDDGKRIRPLERFGVKLMSIGFLMEDPRTAIVWRGPMLHGALNQFLADVNWGDLDYLILDLPPGTGDVALTLAQRLKVTGALMVTTPQEVALQDVYKGVDMCKKLNIPILGVVENMSFFMDSAGVRHELFGKGGGEKVAAFSEAPLIGQIPMETAVREWGDEGTPIVQAAPGSDSGKVFTDVASALSERIALEHFVRGGGTEAPGASGPKRLRILR